MPRLFEVTHLFHVYNYIIARMG